MALNPYIRVNNKTYLPEQNLVEDLTIEAIKIHGLEMYYIPRDMVKRDDLFGESKYSRFNKFRMIEMYMDTTQAFEGGDTFSKFGFEIKDSVKFTVSKKRFIRETGVQRPLEGDLLFLPLNRGLFEIKFVEHENPFYQLGKLFSYQLTCELFQFSEEQFDTGVSDIDAINTETGYKVQVTLGGIYGTGSFAKGDIVYQYGNGSATGGTQGETARAKIQSVDSRESPKVLSLADVSGKWVSGTTSSPLYLSKGPDDKRVYATVVGSTDHLAILDEAKNSFIQTESDSIINFTETNPFGDP
jgi:hypothetical protein